MAFSQTLQSLTVSRLYESSTQSRISSLSSSSSSSSISFRYSPSLLNRKKPLLSIRSATVEGTDSFSSYGRSKYELLKFLEFNFPAFGFFEDMLVGMMNDRFFFILFFSWLNITCILHSTWVFVVV